MLHTLLMFIHFFCAAGIVALVLLQRGKGAEAGAGFGSGASGTVFGARGATTALSRTTAILAAIFMVTSLSLAYVSTHGTNASNSLLDRLAQPAAPAGKSAPVPSFPPRIAPIAPRHAVNPQAAPAASGSTTPNGQPPGAGAPAQPAQGAGAAGQTGAGSGSRAGGSTQSAPHH
jgi:preprotein translocase subunit SecG